MDGIAAIKDNFKQNITDLPTMPTDVKYNFIQLSDSEIATLWLGQQRAQQIHSASHIIVQTSTSLRKVLYDGNEKDALRFIVSTGIKLPHVIVPEVLHSRYSSVLVYQYHKVQHGPLTRQNALSCLKALIRTLKQALDELHSENISHNDLRLPNICFNEQYEAVLIDLDRCCDNTTISPYFSGTVISCMYNCDNQAKFPSPIGKSTDLYQLGWLVAWIVDVDDKVDEHRRKWDSQKDCVKNNQFISRLIQEGVYDSDLMENSFEADTRSIQSCLI